MTPFVIGLVLGAALMHAVWNALLRSGTDRLWLIVVMNMTSAIVALPVAFISRSPSRMSWPYIATSVLLQIGYCIFLERAYREGGLSQVYPIARGASPLLVTLGAAVMTGERLQTSSLAGVAVVSLGIIALAFEGTRPSLKSSWAAVVTGVFIAAFTVTDGVGARLSGHAQSYAAWLFLVQGIAMPLVYITIRGRLAIARGSHELFKAVACGIFAMLAYGAIIAALTLSPMGQVSALRETSILFAALIGVVFLDETLTLRRFSAVVMIAIGAITLSRGH
jgi:drug/metabolite transporter (DMT)-like permease